MFAKTGFETMALLDGSYTHIQATALGAGGETDVLGLSLTVVTGSGTAGADACAASATPSVSSASATATGTSTGSATATASGATTSTGTATAATGMAGRLRVDGVVMGGVAGILGALLFGAVVVMA